MLDDALPVFLDTAYLLALLNARAQWHSRAARWSSRFGLEGIHLITTEFVLTEVGDSCASLGEREQAARAIRALLSSNYTEVVPASRPLFEAALDLYGSRPDKDWGLTDCTSFIVMGDRKLDAALTVDRHFQQAGFRALLLED